MSEKEIITYTSSNEDINNLSVKISNQGYNQCIQDIERLMKNKDPFIRQKLAIILADHINEHSKQVLMDMLHDRSYLVQVEALDSLTGVTDTAIFEGVLSCMMSHHPLVRGYSYRCLCKSTDNRQNIIDRLNLIDEKNVWARIMLDIGRADIGDETAISRLLKAYPKCNYLNRCAIANGIADIFSDIPKKEKCIIREFVAAYSTKSVGVADKEALVRLMSVCEQIDNEDHRARKQGEGAV